MPGGRAKTKWADPNREGRGKGRQAGRFCSKCGNTVQQTRIYKSMNLCEYCYRDLEAARDGIHSCRGCGKVAPLELREYNGYCRQCVCSACGKPDPDYVRKTGLCFQCAATLGDFCRRCGKEAAAQVRKHKGLCDQCASVAGLKLVTDDRIEQTKDRGLRGGKAGNLRAKRPAAGKLGLKRYGNNDRDEAPVIKRSKPFAMEIEAARKARPRRKR